MAIIIITTVARGMIRRQRDRNDSCYNPVNCYNNKAIIKIEEEMEERSKEVSVEK